MVMNNNGDNELRALEVIEQPEEQQRSGAAQEGEIVDDVPENEEDPLEGEQAIIANNRQLRHVTRDALTALRKHNHPPVLYAYGDLLARVIGKAGRHRVMLVGEAGLRGHLARSGNWVTLGSNGAVRGVPPPREVVADILALAEWPFPTLLGVTTVPIVRAEGGVVTAPGYDPASGLFFSADPHLRLPDVPANPTRDEVDAAAALIEELFHDFPWDCDASRAAAWAALLTPLVRPALDGPTPLTLFDKPKQGTGASLLVDAIGLIVTGRDPAKSTAPGADEEWRKRITSLLLHAPTMVVLDNVDQPLASGHLSSVLTDLEWSDRVLGRSEMVRLPNRTVWIATGNNLRTRGDVARRCIWARMDAKMARPWERDPSRFRHPDLRAWVQAERGRLLGALLTLIRAWWSVGCPEPAVRPLGSYEGWSRCVGGVLEVAGQRGFLANLHELYDAADEEATEWSAFLGALWEVFGVGEFTTAELVAQLTKPLRTEGEEAMLQSLPEEFHANDPGLSRRLGKAFAQRAETRYGAYRLVKAGKEHQALTWRVTADREAS